MPSGLVRFVNNERTSQSGSAAFGRSAKEVCCTAVFRDRGCNPQAASTGGYKLLQPVKLICFYMEWIDDDHLV